MTSESYKFTVETEEQAAAGGSTRDLADTLQEADGVIEVVRGKADDKTIDLVQ